MRPGNYFHLCSHETPEIRLSFSWKNERYAKKDELAISVSVCELSPLGSVCIFRDSLALLFITDDPFRSPFSSLALLPWNFFPAFSPHVINRFFQSLKNASVKLLVESYAILLKTWNKSVLKTTIKIIVAKMIAASLRNVTFVWFNHWRLKANEGTFNALLMAPDANFWSMYPESVSFLSFSFDKWRVLIWNDQLLQNGALWRPFNWTPCVVCSFWKRNLASNPKTESRIFCVFDECFKTSIELGDRCLAIFSNLYLDNKSLSFEKTLKILGLFALRLDSWCLYLVQRCREF